MPLPPKCFHAVDEIAIRWGVQATDVVGWAIEGNLTLSVVFPFVEAEAQRASGVVGVAAEDVLPLFRRDESAAAFVFLRRFRRAGEDDDEWRWITKPAEGVRITAGDVLVTRREAERFERQWGVFASPSSDQAKASVPVIGALHFAGPGAPPRHDWDAFNGALVRYIHDHGIPARQSELVRAMADWFATREKTRVPDERTIRRKVSAIWRELTRAP